MIVINKKANITHLPYVQDKHKGVFSFRPGQNTIDPEIFTAICEQIGEKRWNAHYAGLLKPITTDRPDDAVDPSDLNADEAVDLIKGAMDLELLNRYLQAENARKGGPRKTVLAAIDQQSEEIAAIEAAKRSGK